MRVCLGVLSILLLIGTVVAETTECWREDNYILLSSGGAAYLYDNLKKFCKCVMGEYGYHDFVERGQCVCAGYHDAENNENWDTYFVFDELVDWECPTKCAASVVCPDDNSYDTNAFEPVPYFYSTMTAKILSPEDGELVPRGKVIFEGEVNPVIPHTYYAATPPYTYIWSIEGVEVNTMGPTSDTHVSFDKDFSPGEYEIKLTVSNVDYTEEDVIHITVGWTPQEEYIPHMCDQGCVEDPVKCTDPKAPYFCKRSSWWPLSDRCVPQGYDYGFCGGKTEGGGFCRECDQGCFKGLDDCHPNIPGDQPCGPDEYCCRKSIWVHDCVPEGFDRGCCGGPTEKETITTIEETFTGTGASSCTDKIMWEVQGYCGGDWIDVSADCEEGNYNEIDLTVNPGEAKRATCTSKKIPSKYSGIHCAKVTWCGVVDEFRYSGIEGTMAAKILSPEDGEILPKGKVVFKGEVNPSGTPPYNYIWSIDGEGVKSMGPISDTHTSFDKDDLSLGDHEIKLSVSDVEYTAEDVITVTVLPGVSIISPEDGERYLIGNVPFKGEVFAGTPPYTYAWSVDGVEIETFESIQEATVSFNRNDLSAGDHVVKLTVTDNEGVVSKDSVEITLMEGLLVSITSPKDGDAFVRKSLITFASSVEGGTPPYTYSWDIGGKYELSGWTFNFPVDLPLGYHDIVLDVTDDEGRTGTHKITIDFAVECEKGPNTATPCEFHKPSTVIYETGQITVCDPEPPMKKIINEWILSDPVLREQVKQGIYDDAVRKIFKKTNEIYLYGYRDDCDKRPASGFLGEEYLFDIDTKFESVLNSGTATYELRMVFHGKGHSLYSHSPRVRKVSDEEWRIANVGSGAYAYYIYIIKKQGGQLNVYRIIKYGCCRQWSAVLLSLIRTMGVSQHRVHILGFGTIWSITDEGGEFENGHHVVAYQSDSVNLWILDITDPGNGGCGKLIDISSWRNTCPYESVCQTSRWFYVNDHGGHRWDDCPLLPHVCEYIDGMPASGLMPTNEIFPVSWIK